MLRPGLTGIVRRFKADEIAGRPGLPDAQYVVRHAVHDRLAYRRGCVDAALDETGGVAMTGPQGEGRRVERRVEVAILMQSMMKSKPAVRRHGLAIPYEWPAFEGLWLATPLL